MALSHTLRNNDTTVNNVLELYTLMYWYNLHIETYSFVKLPAPLLFLCFKQMWSMVLIILEDRAGDICDRVAEELQNTGNWLQVLG